MKKYEKLLKHEYLKEQLKYEPETGDFYWLISKKKRNLNKPAGSRDRYGYKHICIDGMSFSQHRLAWYYINGVWPKEEIDHINGKPSDNRIENLREATHAENSANRARRRINSSGYKGVYRDSTSGMWRVQLSKDGKVYTAGPYMDPARAHDVHQRMSQLLFQEFHRPYPLKIHRQFDKQDVTNAVEEFLKGQDG